MSPKPNERTDARRNMYKSSVDADEGRRKREDNMVEIRKNKREESLQKKRRERVLTTSMEQQEQRFLESLSSQKRMETLPQMVTGVMPEDRNSQLEATIGLRKLVSGRNPPIDEVVQTGVVPRLVQFLTRDDFPYLQFEAAWALTNIASGTSENTKAIIDSGAVPLFIQLLSNNSEEIREQAVWALGNVAGDSSTYRDYVLSCGFMTPLLAQFNANTKISLLRNATWALSNLCRGKPEPALEKTTPALPILKQLLLSTDEEVLTEASWALSYLSEGANNKIQTVIDCGVIPRLVQLLAHPLPQVVAPALHTIGQIVTGDDLQTQVVIDHQALPGLLNILTNPHKKSIKKDALWTISNIAAGNTSQIQEVFAAGLMQHVISLLQYGDFQIKKEAAWAVTNVTSCGSHDQIKFLVSQGCIKPLCNMLTCHDAGTVQVILSGLENILKAGEIEKNQGNTGGAFNRYAEMIDDEQGWDKIESLQDHSHESIYKQAVKLLDSYWVEDENDEDIHQNGKAPPPGGFNFG